MARARTALSRLRRAMIGSDMGETRILIFPAPLMGRVIAFGETVAFLSAVIPAEAGIQRPKTRHSPLDSRLRGNDGNREVGEPKCDCPASMGVGELVEAFEPDVRV